jgi:hypothetical protein
MHTSTRRSRVGGAGGGAAALVIMVLGLAAPASATSYVNRGLNLRAETFELGLGVGVAHSEPIGDTGVGLNLEVGYGFTSNLELRFRTGLRLGSEGRRTDADYWGRPVDSETLIWALDSETVANPEVALRLGLNRGGTAELAFDARLYLPIDGPFGFQLGLPIALHLGRLRLDTGIFVPIILTDPNTSVHVSVPLHLWIRFDSGAFFGPMTGIYWYDDDSSYYHSGGETIPLGVGAGTSLAYDADLRFWLLFHDVDDLEGWWGFGVGLYVTF